MNIFEEGWKSIVKPTQIKSKMTSLGPKHRVIQSMNIVRIDLTVINRNGKKISGYLFYSPDIQANETILYLHGNGGSKLEALPFVQLIPSFGFNLAAFDLLGCGNSDPQFLSYGVNQVFDIRDMLQQIRKHIKVGRIVLWGRSMGSICAIMFADMYSYEVNALVLDSPFRYLSNLVQRIAQKKVQLPLFILKPFLYLIEQRAIKEVGYDIFSIDYLSILKKLNNNLPILFVFSNYDTIVPAQEVFDFYNKYQGPKDIYEIYHSHDQDRPEQLFKQGIMWITRVKRKSKKGLIQARQHMMHQKREEEQIRSRSEKRFICYQEEDKGKFHCW